MVKPLKEKPLEDIVDGGTAEVVQILRNTARSPDSVLARAADAIEQLARSRADLLDLTAQLDEHPEDYDGECWCKLCQSYAG